MWDSFGRGDVLSGPPWHTTWNRERDQAVNSERGASPFVRARGGHGRRLIGEERPAVLRAFVALTVALLRESIHSKPLLRIEK